METIDSIYFPVEGPEMKRILHVLRAVKGGMANHVQTLVTGAEFGEFQHDLACPIALTPTSLLEAAHEVFELSIVDGLTPVADFRAQQQLAHLLHVQTYDVIHFHGYKALYIGSKLLRYLPYRPKVMCTVHNFLSKKQQIWWHIAHKCGFLNFNTIDQFITVSEELKQHFEQINRSLPIKQEVQVIYNGLSPTRHYVDRRFCCRIFQVPRSSFVIGTIARLNPDKGIEFLIRAVADIERRIPNLYLVIIGDGPEQKRLMTLAKQLGFGNIRWLGYREGADQFMQGFDLYVQPSLREGFGITVLEAMRASIPVIASRVGGLQEIVENQVSGYLVNPGDVKDLARAIFDLYRDGWLRSELGFGGYERMQDHFSEESMLQQWCQLYKGQGEHVTHMELKNDAVFTNR